MPKVVIPLTHSSESSRILAVDLSSESLLQGTQRPARLILQELQQIVFALRLHSF